MIKFSVSNEGRLSPTPTTPVSDSLKFESVAFDFPESWKGFSKTAVFKNENNTVNIALDEANEYCIEENHCYIPNEMLRGTEFYISVFGVKGDSRATSTRVTVSLISSGYELGDQPKDPTQSVYEQLLNISDETKQIALSVREDADSGEFNGEKGDKGDRGDSGIYYGTTEPQGLPHPLWVNLYGEVKIWNETTGEYEGLPTLKGEKGDIGAIGPKGDKGEKGDTGAQGIQGIQGDQGVQGFEGPKGDKGDPFAIAEIYSSVSEMNADYNNYQIDIGSFVLINTGNVDDEDNAKIYVKGNTAYEYITDLSGAQGVMGPKGDRGEQGVKGDQGPQGIQGIPGEQGIQGERGYSGLIPRQRSPYYSEVIVPANTMVNYNQLTGEFSVSLGSAVSGYDNEWSFTITQGDYAFDVFLPTIHWGLGIAPTFSANTTTLCRLYYLGTTLCGEWVSI